MQSDTLTHILGDARDKALEIQFVDGSNDESTLSAAELWEQSLAMLGELQHRGMQAGDELIVYANSNRRFLIAFWAAILGGIVPVPIAVGSNDEHRAKLFRIMRQLQHATLYTDHEQRRRLEDYARPRDYRDIMRKLRSRAIVDEELTGNKSGDAIETNADAMAFIQYSSGSTSDPKGVCLTHANLISNIAAIVEGTGWTADDRSLSWMPLTHDMGLIGFHLSVLAAGMSHAIMDTSVFVRRPLLWMIKAQEYAATQLCSPNFGYKHFLKVFRSKGLDELDLSAVRLILNGAEPISWSLCEEFLDAMAPYGLKKSTMLPVYGLAEATVAVSIPEPGRQYARIVVDRHSLSIGQPISPLEDNADDAVSFVKVGRAVRDCEIRIVDDHDEVLDDAVIGHIQVRGANVTQGIYGDRSAGDALFASHGWLRTGDCGAVVDGELVITGRARELIIVNGQNYYPHDIEEMIARLDGLDLGKVVVCGAAPERSRTEELLVFVLHRSDYQSLAPLAQSVREIVARRGGLEVDHVIPVTRIPKTTSGKVQRSKLASAYLDGEFDEEIRALAALSTDAVTSETDPLIRELVQVCRDISKEVSIGPDDNLFEVGVTSLTLTEIVLAIDERHPGKLDISDLFDYPTIRELARFIRR